MDVAKPFTAGGKATNIIMHGNEATMGTTRDAGAIEADDISPMTERLDRGLEEAVERSMRDFESERTDPRIPRSVVNAEAR
jgi:hypothetical protein